ncbi:hypothetical protein [Stutzerimonas stutzeri]|uniref:hypothetical protein n=1 Tax=Stutzerimonas stutzeri TaxID=316 RepID=UPI0013A5765B|nr:hypothetical protein [Stutzerimonas stutzeri]
MGLTLHDETGPSTYQFVGWENNVFLLCNDNGNFAEIYTPLNLDDEYKDEPFDIYFLAKKDVVENEIYQVYSSQSRIGWCIPINALGSDLHDYADHPHFLKYAYKAIEGALRYPDDSNIYRATAEIDHSGQINFLNLFHPYTVILVICRNTVTLENPFIFEHCIPSLVKNGYQPLTTKNPSQICHVGIPPQGSRLRLNSAAEGIENFDVILSILTSVIAYEGNAVFRFFYIYQIFELLIESILKLEQEEVIENLYQSKADPAKSREILKNLKDMTSEQERLRLLVTKYSNCAAEAQEIRRSCQSLTTSLGLKSGNNFEEFFYPIRNFLVHRLREFPEESVSQLEDVVLHTIDYVSKILSKFNAKPAS